jgi:hypothetical protein
MRYIKPMLLNTSRAVAVIQGDKIGPPNDSDMGAQFTDGAAYPVDE